MSVKEKIELDLTDYKQVALEIRDKAVQKSNSEEIAINMLKKSYEVNSVSEITALTVEEVEELKKNLK